MKEKSQFEKNAADKQVELLSGALNGAVSAGGHWLNATGKGYPKFYPAGVAVSPFNALFMALHSDKHGCKSNLFTLYSEAKARGESVKEHEKGVPFLFYNWNKYVNRNNPNEVISRNDYQKLSPEEKNRYKGVHNREIRTLFNIDQTLLPHVDRKAYDDALAKYGNSVEQGFGEKELRELRPKFNAFVQSISRNLAPIRTDGSGVAHYDSQKDAIYIPRQKDFAHYTDYAQETLRQIIAATGHQQRLAREGMVMKNGMPPSDDAVKQERLVVEIASGIKMLELGLPARLSDESLSLVEYWDRELKENPNMIDALESDVNNALEVIRKAERGEKIEYATLRNRKQTSDMQDQLPKHYFVADELRKRPDKDKKTIVLVIDPVSKSADVILPAGASPEVDNEIPGMNKARIGRALRREGIETVRFFNPDGALGYRPDDKYFAEKQVSLARLNNWALEVLSTLNVSPAVKRANEVGFDKIQMIQDDKNRWALYIKPEHQRGYSIYPDKEDINRFFSTLKQSMDNIDKVRMELAHKYYALAEIKPDLKVDLFNSGTQDVDLNRIQRVSVFKTKQDGVLCAVTIDGQKLQPRSVSPQQWQRMWVAEDRDSYKRHLAASLFADILQKGQSQEEHAGEKQEKETEIRQGEAVSRQNGEERTVESVSPQREAWDKIKAKHPDAIQFVRTGDNYTAYNEDAVKVTETLALKMEKHEADMKKGFTASVTFPVSQLDTFLQKLARSGARVVIRDAEGLADARNRTTGITERTAGNGQTRTLFDTAQEKQSERRIEPEENEQRSSMRR